MKLIPTFFFLLLILIAGVPAVQAQTGSTSSVVPPEKSGIVFVDTVHNFGKIKQHDQVTHEYVFYNRGNDTLHLSKPHASCGCTAVLLSNNSIAPGDSGSMAVRFTAVPGASGPVEKNVYINDASVPPRRLAVITVKANIIGDIAIDQNYIRYTSTVGENEKLHIHVTATAEEAIVLDNISVALMEYADTSAGRKYDVKNVRASPVTEFTIEVKDKELDPGDETDIYVTVPSREKGQINGSIRISLPHSIMTVGVSGVIERPEEGTGE